MALKVNTFVPYLFYPSCFEGLLLKFIKDCLFFYVKMIFDLIMTDMKVLFLFHYKYRNKYFLAW